MAESAAAKKQQEAPQTEPHKYHVIKIHGKRYETEQTVVSVNVNGKQFNMQRQQLIPVPDYVAEVLKNAQYPNFKTEPGHTRKTEGYIQRYPFEVVYRNISREVYGKLKTLAKSRELTETEIEELLDKK